MSVVTRRSSDDDADRALVVDLAADRLRLRGVVPPLALLEALAVESLYLEFTWPDERAEWVIREVLDALRPRRLRVA